MIVVMKLTHKFRALLAGIALGAVLLLGNAAIAKADVFDVLTFPAFNDGTHFVGTELGSLNGGTPFTIQCIDISHTISIPTSYNVTVFTLGGDLTGLRFFDGTNTDAFLKAAFLFQLGQADTQDVTTQSNIQRAIWSLFPHAAGNDPYLNTPGALAFVALANAGILDGSFLAEVAAGDFKFYSPSGGGLVTDAPGQLFISQVPEPGTWAMLVVSGTSLLGFAMWRRRPGFQADRATA
jgi:hypothetical protein